MGVVLNESGGAEGRQLIDALSGFGAVLAIKLYRLSRGDTPDLPTLPCLDHEAMLHSGIPPHAASDRPRESAIALASLRLIALGIVITFLTSG